MLLSYVDDVQTYKPIKCQNDVHLLQTNLNCGSRYDDVNVLRLNASDFCTITFSKSDKPFNFKYKRNNKLIKNVSSSRI